MESSSGSQGDGTSVLSVGSTKVEGDKTFIWTKRVLDDFCTVFEWVEQKPVYDYYIPTDDIYF
jgi:hypothetical protein